ncbi:MAG: acyl-CoA dehydrogenase family protein [Bacteroidales bacterium]|nr:acyl-CoA dehydrogenase family protein [Bacteroidales bacterium]
MNFDLTKQQIEFREKVRDFAEREVKPVAAYNDENEIFDVELTKKMADLGLLGICVPKEYGGQELDTLSYIIAVEELARIDGSTAATIAADNSLGISPIKEYGTKEQKEKYLPRLCKTHLWGFGLTEENAGCDSRGTQSTARQEGDSWILNGSKIFITNSATPMTLGSTLQVISGEKNGKPEFTTFLMENDAEGFTQEPMNRKMMWRASNTGRLTFENVRLPKENMLGAAGEGSHIMLSTLDGGRLSIAAMGLGCAQGAYEMALAYSQKREQFGKPVCKFQAVSFTCIDEVASFCSCFYFVWFVNNSEFVNVDAFCFANFCDNIFIAAQDTFYQTVVDSSANSADCVVIISVSCCQTFLWTATQYFKHLF